jgi:hypothetical protein
LGSGAGTADVPEPADSRDEHPRPGDRDWLFQQDLVTPVPIKMAIEKLRGFVADHDARIVAIDGNNIRLETAGGGGWFRRRSDRSVCFVFELRFEEEQIQKEEGETRDAILRTRIHVAVRPRRSRDRRLADVEQRGRQMLASFRSYLMAGEGEDEPPAGSTRRITRLLTPWTTNP